MLCLTIAELEARVSVEPRESARHLLAVTGRVYNKLSEKTSTIILDALTWFC